MQNNYRLSLTYTGFDCFLRHTAVCLYYYPDSLKTIITQEPKAGKNRAWQFTKNLIGQLFVSLLTLGNGQIRTDNSAFANPRIH